MALYVDTSKLTTPESADLTPEEIDQVRYTIGVALMVVGMTKIETAADCAEALFRARMYERLVGQGLVTGPDGAHLSGMLAFWVRWQGVRANVAPETRAKWLKRMVTQTVQDLDYAIRQEM